MGGLLAALVALAIVLVGEAFTAWLLLDAVVDVACVPISPLLAAATASFVVVSWFATMAFLRGSRRPGIRALGVLGALWIAGTAIDVIVAVLGLARPDAALSVGLEGFAILFWVMPLGVGLLGVALLGVAITAARQPAPAVAATPAVAPARLPRRRYALAIAIVLAGLFVIGIMTPTASPGIDSTAVSGPFRFTSNAPCPTGR